MSLVELYKTHICENPTGYEMHQFFSSFNLCVYVKHYDPEIERQNMLGRMRDKQFAREWIYKNSNL
jgi:hypothetical protein